MNRATPIVFVVAFLVLWTSAECVRGLNPCHSGRSFSTVASTCQAIVLPPSLCRKCRIRAVDPDGFFPDCEQIYNLNGACESAIGEYVELNPCDDKRIQQFATLDDPLSRRLLDFFIYTVCEECCDCIPFGAKADEYDERRQLGREYLTSLTRGNCAVHARFDICSIWPNVRDVVRENETPRINRPQICPIIEEWFQSPLSEGWETNNVTINFQMSRFLKKFNRVAKCRSRRVWEECTALEVAQNRV